MSVSINRAAFARVGRTRYLVAWAAPAAALGMLCGCESWDGPKNMERREAFYRAVQEERWDDAERVSREMKRSVPNSGPMVEQAIFQAFLDAGQYDRAAAHADAAHAALANDPEAMRFLARQVARSPGAMGNAKLRAFGRRCAENAGREYPASRAELVAPYDAAG